MMIRMMIRMMICMMVWWCTESVMFPFYSVMQRNNHASGRFTSPVSFCEADWQQLDSVLICNCGLCDWNKRHVYIYIYIFVVCILCILSILCVFCVLRISHIHAYIYIDIYRNPLENWHRPSRSARWSMGATRWHSLSSARAAPWWSACGQSMCGRCLGGESHGKVWVS